VQKINTAPIPVAQKTQQALSVLEVILGQEHCHMLGVTKEDWLTNEAIRKTLKVNSLNDTITECRDSWFNCHTNGSQSFTMIYAIIQTYQKEKCRLPKEEMDKSDLRSHNGQKPNA
jgi:hypothetical protein